MHRKFNPPSIHDPGTYMHGVEVAANSRWLHIAGQVGKHKDGTIPPDMPAQAEAAFSNVLEVLKGAGMGPDDIVRLTTYITNRDDLPAMRAARAKVLGDIRVASTLLIVVGLAEPRLRIEVDCTAAKL